MGADRADDAGKSAIARRARFPVSGSASALESVSLATVFEDEYEDEYEEEGDDIFERFPQSASSA